MALGIITYLKSLIPHIEKKDVLEDLRLTETELQTIVLPAFAAASAFFAKDKFKSDENSKIESRFRSLMKPLTGNKSSTFLGDYHHRLIKFEHNVGVLVKAIDKEIGRDVVTDGVSSKKIVLLRIAEKASYLSRYSLDLLNLVYLNEASANGADVSNIAMSPAELAKAKGCVDNLARLIMSYGIETKEFQTLLDKTPDVILTKTKNADIEGMYTDNELDPITSPMLTGFTGNLIYHARMFIAEWQTKRYKANQEKKKVLELRLLHLTLLRNKEGTNPKIEQEIAYNQSRVAKIDRSLLEVQEDLGLAA